MQFTNYKPRRNDKAPEADRSRFEKVIERMVRINEVYERIKGEEKVRRYEEEMFQKDYNRLMRSSDSESLSEDHEDPSDNDRIYHKSTTRRRNINKDLTPPRNCEEPNAEEGEGAKGETNSNPSHIMPTVIIKSQQNLENQQPNS